MSIAHPIGSNGAIMTEALTLLGEALNGAPPATALAVVLVLGGLIGMLACIHEGTREVR